MSQSLTDALAYERGQRIDLRNSELLAAPKAMRPREIRQLRASLNASQRMFARFLCVSPKAVQSWEQGARRPGSTALRLLTIAKKHPEILLQA
jgi:putative transcriptional regulator